MNPPEEKSKQLQQPINIASNDSGSELYELNDTNETRCLGLTLQKKTSQCLQLSLVFILLILVGAGIFMAIEYPNEQKRLESVRNEYTLNRKSILNILKYNVTNNTPEEIYTLLQPYSSGFQSSANDINNWTFTSAIIFSFTIITTIGYGTFTPSTPGGQVFLVIYALIGIPAAGIALGVIAERALYIFTWLSMVGSDKTLAAFKQFDEDDSGELDKSEFKAAVELLGFDLSEPQFNKLWMKVDEDESGLVDFDEFAWAIEFMHADVTEAAGRKHRIYITLFSIIFWVSIGMISFMISESWRPETTFYFLFVSLTTVGLGDFFPKSSFGVSFLIIWCMVGLGLLAVLLTLIQGLLEDFEKAREMNEEERKQLLLIRKLKECPILSEMNNDDVKLILNKMKKEVYTMNTKIVNENEKIKSFYMIISGTVSLDKSSLEWNKLLSSTSFFGESMLSNSVIRKWEHSVSVISQSVKVLSLHYEDWEILLKSGDLKYNNSSTGDILLTVENSSTKEDPSTKEKDVVALFDDENERKEL